MTKKYDLIIFDCDGTLVDSEEFYSEQKSQIFQSVGLTQYTPAKCREEFNGTPYEHIEEVINLRHNMALPEGTIERLRQQAIIESHKHTIEVSGALNFVKALSAQKKQIAVGSGGVRSIVIKSLKLKGFMNYFSEQTVFTTCQVENAKPAPDLYLYVAEEIGVCPSKCLVIEDSVFGVQSAIAAKMDVYGITAALQRDQKHITEYLKKMGAKKVFESYSKMQKYLSDVA